MTDPPPPDTAPGAAPTPEPLTPPSLGPQAEEPWDRARRLAIAWFHPLTEREGWMAALYLLVGMFSCTVFFVAVWTAGWATFGLLFAGIGLLAIRPAFGLTERLCDAERAMATWVGVTIPPRPMRPMRRIGWAALSDNERWRQVGFISLNIVIGNLLGTAGLASYWMVPRLFSGDSDGLGLLRWDWSPLGWLVSVAVAGVAAGAAPRIAVAVARLKAQITAWFLGPDQLAAAEARVTVLAAQRQDILDAVASERRRIERNLHDGVQQQLVAIGLDLGMAEARLAGGTSDASGDAANAANAADVERARELVRSAREKIQGSIGELRQLGRGLHPAILADRGIDAALSAVVANSPIPISVHVDPGLDLPTDVAETVYFVANEAIANVLKHAKARVASVHVTKVAANVRVTVHDDGCGGADASRGTGLAGIRARVNAVDGMVSVSSPVGGPTTIVVELPRTVAPPRGANGHG